MTFKEAKDSGLAIGKTGTKANWQRHPDDMLFARCVSKGYRRYSPELSGGVVSYDPDELDHYNPRVVHVGAHNEIITIDREVATLLTAAPTAA